jgi:CubicO group peptidase (beta-lactamase class C family)
MKSILTASLCILLLHTCYGQAPAAKHQISPQALHQLDSLFHYLDATGYYNGNILVAVGGKKVAGASLGYSNIATGEKLTEASPFELASVSKQFTAVGVLKLVANGKLGLDQKLETIFPEIPYKGITIRNLLNHTSGLPSYEQMMSTSWDQKKIATNRDILTELVRLHPEASFAPGSNWEYSNTGYAMLALVIEKVSGKSYAKYMQEAVFKPLGLKHTFIYMRRYAPTPVAGYAYGYVKNDNGDWVLPDSLESYSYVRYLDGIGGDGTVNTTVGDLLIWNNAARDGKLLPANLWKEAVTPPVIAGKSTSYGMGWEVVSNPERGRVLRHNGGWPGYITSNVLYLDKDVSLIYLGNKDMPGYLTQGTYDAVKNIVFGKEFKFPEPLRQTVAAIDKGLYAKYVGTYITSEMPGFELTIKDKDGSLYAQATGQGEIELKPESETMFFVPDLPIKMEFKASGGKNADILVLHQNGDHEFKRKQ